MLEKFFSEDDDDKNYTDLMGTIRVLKPENFLDCYQAATLLRSDEILLIDIDNMKTEFKQRYLDFISGVVMAIDGKIRKIDRSVVLCVPAKFELAGEINNGQ